MSSTCLVRAPCGQVLRQSQRALTEAVRQPQTRGFTKCSILQEDDNEEKGKRSTSKRSPTTFRRKMFQWLNTQGSGFRHHQPGHQNYMNDRGGPSRRPSRSPRPRRRDVDEEEEEDDHVDEDEPEPGAQRNQLGQPFPLNPQFRSEPVLSDALKAGIVYDIVDKKMSVSAVSVKYSVDMRRVTAVIRLAMVEKKWTQQGKPLLAAYSNAIMSMLPQTVTMGEHETINDLPVHSDTLRQIFHPTSESREFTREDAARIFSPTLLTADERIPHPELIEKERPEHAGKTPAQLEQIMEEHRQGIQDSKDRRAKAKRLDLERRTTVVKSDRFDFRFEDVRADNVGKDGRGASGVVSRYGFPHEDRKRGQSWDKPLSVPS